MKRCHQKIQPWREEACSELDHSGGDPLPSTNTTGTTHHCLAFNGIGNVVEANAAPRMTLIKTKILQSLVQPLPSSVHTSMRFENHIAGRFFILLIKLKKILGP